MNQSVDIDYMPVYKEILSPTQFLSLSSNQKSNIKKVNIIIPALGSDSFGAFEVEYLTPRFDIYNSK